MEEDKIILDRKSFEALAGETRIKILKSLSQRRKTLTELSDELDLSVSSIKEHLENLESANFITKIDDGHKWKYYKLTKKGKEITAPKELRVWVLLSIALIALVASSFMLLQYSASQPVYLSSTVQKTESAKLEPLAAAPSKPSELPLATALDSETNKSKSNWQNNPRNYSAITSAQEDLLPPTILLLITGVSMITVIACLAILIKNRLRTQHI